MKKVEFVDISTVCIFKLIKDKPECAKYSVAPNPAYLRRLKELISRGYVHSAAKYSGLTLTEDGEALFARLMEIVDAFEMNAALEECIMETRARAEHKKEYAKDWCRKKKDEKYGN